MTQLYKISLNKIIRPRAKTAAKHPMNIFAVLHKEKYLFFVHKKEIFLSQKCESSAFADVAAEGLMIFILNNILT